MGARPTVPVPAASSAATPVAVSPSPPPPPLGRPVHRIKGWLRTVGTQIVDDANHPVRLVSIGINGMQKGSGTPDTEPQPYSGCFGWKPLDDAAYRLIPAWGFNSVRVQITWANLEPSPPSERGGGKVVHHWNSAYLAAVDEIVRGFSSRGVAVILEMNQVRWSPAFHQIPTPSGGKLCGTGMPTWLYPPELGIDSIASVERAFFADKGGIQELFTTAWKFVARRYAKERLVIGADLLNEPYDLLVQSYPGGTEVRPRDLRLEEFYEKVGSAIHAVNPKLLLIFEDNRSRRTSKWSVVDEPDLPNAVYSVHWYSPEWSSPGGLPKLRRYVDRAREWDLPIWIGEFNAFHYTSRVPAESDWAADLRAFLAYAKRNDVSWTITSYGSGQIQEAGSEEPKPRIIELLRSGF